LELVLGFIPAGSRDLGLSISNPCVKEQPLEVQYRANVRNRGCGERSPIDLCAEHGSARGPQDAQPRQERRFALGYQRLRRGPLRKSSLQVGAGLQRGLNKRFDVTFEL